MRNIGHGVDRGAAAEHLARTKGLLCAVLGRRLVGPDKPVMRQHFGEAGRDVDEGVVIRGTGFDQCDRRIRVFGEIARDDAAAGASANDDDVIGLLGHPYLLIGGIS